MIKFWKKKERTIAERCPRIRLLLSDGMRIGTEEGEFPLLNLSESGVGFLAENNHFQRNFAAKIHFGQISVDVSLEVVRKDGSFVGAKFIGDTGELRKLLRKQFMEEIRATEMSEVAPESLRKEEYQGKPRWFYAPGNYELFFTEEKGKVLRVEMEWNGRVISVEGEELPRIGNISPEDRQKPAHSKSSLVQWEAELSDADRNKAIRIVENVRGLDVEIRGQIVKMLRRMG
jgi:hypothetical protein